MQLSFVNMEKTKGGACLKRQKSRNWGRIMMSTGEPRRDDNLAAEYGVQGRDINWGAISI